MGYPTIGQLEQGYKDFVALKPDHPAVAERLVLFNQNVLRAAGAIHARCLRVWEPGGKEEYEAFVRESFAGAYYANWRRDRAVSVASLCDISARLNVAWLPEQIRGETFYAGIPPITAEEIACASRAAGLFRWEQVLPDNIVQEKIGVDGKYHPVDRYGDFLGYPYDPKDIYADGSGVTLEATNA